MKEKAQARGAAGKEAKFGGLHIDELKSPDRAEMQNAFENDSVKKNTDRGLGVVK